jgi:hypothetical protein
MILPLLRLFRVTCLLMIAIKNVHGTNFKYGPGASTVYPASGDIGDWLYSRGIPRPIH